MPTNQTKTTAKARPKPSGVKSSSAREGEQIRKLQDQVDVLHRAVKALAAGNLEAAKAAIEE